MPTVTHVVAHLMHRCKQKGENLQEFNFEFSELIQAVSNCEPKHTTDPLKVYVNAQNLFNAAI